MLCPTSTLKWNCSCENMYVTTLFINARGHLSSISSIVERSILREIVSAIHQAVCSGDGILCVACAHAQSTMMN
jgi:hypothetical protein